MDGLVHLYYGDGKGKTTAAAGLAARAAGRGGGVVFAQFLKNADSGEVRALEKAGVEALHAEETFGFTFTMDGETRKRCARAQRGILERAAERVARGGIALLVLDEALDALNAAMLDEDALRAVFDRAGGVDIALTGRDPPAWLVEAASYVTEMRKIKHPYDRGVAARAGIEL